ncbi:hypothetical protein [Nocardia sp. NPDC050710]|uniref:hypothetical protein n=1 Tax=Nocardia sp. NPDC050710 TaxID=3157220 RepID=UPI0033DA180B
MTARIGARPDGWPVRTQRSGNRYAAVARRSPWDGYDIDACTLRVATSRKIGRALRERRVACEKGRSNVGWYRIFRCGRAYRATAWHQRYGSTFRRHPDRRRRPAPVSGRRRGIPGCAVGEGL